jgi:hypothetical protein
VPRSGLSLGDFEGYFEEFERQFVEHFQDLEEQTRPGLSLNIFPHVRRVILRSL